MSTTYIFPPEGEPLGAFLELSAKFVFPDESTKANATIKPEKPFFLPRGGQCRIRLSPSGQRLLIEFVEP